MKCDVIDGSVLNGARQPINYCFRLDKPPGHKVFSELETVHLKKIEPVLNNITSYLEDDNNDEVNFNGETLTFTVQLIEVGAFK